MKKYIILFLLVSFPLIAQFKDQPVGPTDVKSGILSNNGPTLFGFFNPNNFKMNHTFDISYQTFGAGSFALTTYTNSMFYKVNDQLNIEADISLVNSPYNSFDKKFGDAVNGLYLSRAQINYKPADNMAIVIQYRNTPFNYYNYWWNGYSPFYRNSFFE